MCGIVGYVGSRKAQPLLLAGLEKLEYRGYDSAGVSVLRGERIETVRAVGNLSQLRDAIAARPEQAQDRGRVEHAVVGRADSGAVALAEPSQVREGAGAWTPVGTGIGHTRWATHGRVTEANAHPHSDTRNRIHVVVNGIVENYAALKEELIGEGAVFTSDTDSEVIAHLIARHYEGDLVEAVRLAYGELRGHYALVAMSADEPGLLVGARKECPLIVGRGDGEQFIGSAIPAFLKETR
ncbi:MAG TPA: glutamine--fructose-6-phosphate aminotransferase, partial [Solirubrobacteraceae bacterium]